MQPFDEEMERAARAPASGLGEADEAIDKERAVGLLQASPLAPCQSRGGFITVWTARISFCLSARGS